MEWFSDWCLLHQAVLTWGAGTCEVITKNLPSDLQPLVNVCLLVKALLSFPLPFYSAAEILQSCLLTGEYTFLNLAPLLYWFVCVLCIFLLLFSPDFNHLFFLTIFSLQVGLSDVTSPLPPQMLKVRVFPARLCWSEPPCWWHHTSWPCWSPGSRCWWVWQEVWPVPSWPSYCRVCVTSDCRGADSQEGSTWWTRVSWLQELSVVYLASSVQWKGYW